MLQINTNSDIRHLIRKRITPFGGWTPDKRTFPVGWKSLPMTFEEIMNDLRHHIVQDLLYFRKIARQYIGDLVQQGWFRLWKALQENVAILETMSCRDAADFICNRTGVTTFRDYLKRYDSYHALSRWNDDDSDVFEDTITDIVIGSSLKSTGHGRHALFTHTTDCLIDIKSAICEVATWCGDDIRKLAALYYVTTSVSQVDAGRIAGLPITLRDGRLRCSGMQYWSKVVLERLREALVLYKPIEPNCNEWREKLKAGETEPICKLAEKYADDELKLLALYVLTTRVSRETVVRELGVNDSKLWYWMSVLRQQLRCMYASDR